MSEKSALEQARDHVESIRRDIYAAGEGSKERVALNGQLTQALKHEAKLSGAFEVTHSTVLRSPAWGDVVKVLREVWVKYPDALAALEAKLKELTGE